MLQHDLMYKDRCRVNLLSHRDQNSTYFHNMWKVRKAQNPIVSDKAVIFNHIGDFYSSLFKKVEVIFNCDEISSSIIVQDNAFLISLLSSEEIQKNGFQYGCT